MDDSSGPSQIPESQVPPPRFGISLKSLTRAATGRCGGSYGRRCLRRESHRFEASVAGSQRSRCAGLHFLCIIACIDVVGDVKNGRSTGGGWVLSAGLSSSRGSARPTGPLRASGWGVGPRNGGGTARDPARRPGPAYTLHVVTAHSRRSSTVESPNRSDRRPSHRQDRHRRIQRHRALRSELAAC